MEKLLVNISSDKKLNSIIKITNNPYWLVKGLMREWIDPYVLLQYGN